MAPVVLGFSVFGIHRTQFRFEDPLTEFDMERGGIEATEYILAYERNVWSVLGRKLDATDAAMIAGIAAVLVVALVAT